jgi:hypothetical protein
VVCEKERLTTTTAGLREPEAWLADRQVERVAMEVTGVYWKPVLYALESKFTVGCLRCCRHSASVIRGGSAAPDPAHLGETPTSTW